MKGKLAGVFASALVFMSQAAFAGYGHEGKVYGVLDLGYGMQDSDQTITLTGITSKGKGAGRGLAFSGGFGYYLLDELRVEGSLYADQGMESKKSVSSGTKNVAMYGKEKSFGAFANAYFDVLNESNIIPYVMVGAGFLRNEFESELKIPGTGTGRESKSKFSKAYQGGAGINYHLSSSLDLDFGYRYINKGEKEYKFTVTSVNAGVKAKAGPTHIAVIGFRSTF